MFSDTNDPLHGEPMPTEKVGSEEEAVVAPRSTLRSIGIVGTCTCAMMLNIVATTTVSIAFPTIGAELNIPAARLQWVASAYALSSGCLLLFFGRLADLYGRRRAFLLGALALLAFSIGCAQANDEITLDVLRGMQGCGGAAMIPAALGILAHAFPDSRARTLAFATFSAGAPVGAAFGMVMGGVLTQLTQQTWRSVFYFSAGFAALCFAGALAFIDADLPSTEADRRVDWLGAFLSTSGLVLIVFVLSDGETAKEGWSTPYIIALLVLGVALVAAFLVWQGFLERRLDDPDQAKVRSRWTPPPLMRLSLWTRARGKLAAMLCIAFLNWAGFIGWTFWAQLYYQNYLGLSPILTMVRQLPMCVTGVLCNVFVALLVGRVDLLVLVLAGTLLTSLASLLFAVIPGALSTSYWAFGFPSAVLAVFGADFVFASGTLFVARAAEGHEQSVAGALFNTMTQLGTAFGLTIGTIVFDRVSEKEHGAGGIGAYHAAHWADFAFGVLASLLAAVFLRNVGIIGARHGKAGEDAEQGDGAQTPVGRDVDEKAYD